MRHSVKITYRYGKARGEFLSHGYVHYAAACERRDRKISELRALGYEVTAFSIVSMRAA